MYLIFFKYLLLLIIWFVCSAKITVAGEDKTHDYGKFKLLVVIAFGSLIIFLK